MRNLPPLAPPADAKAKGIVLRRPDAPKQAGNGPDSDIPMKPPQGEGLMMKFPDWNSLHGDKPGEPFKEVPAKPFPNGYGGTDYVPLGEAGKARFDLIPFDKITFDTAPAYRVKGLLCSTGLIVVWGPPKCGKSFFVFDLVMHVALGWEYRGRRVRQGNVVYCALEGCAAFKNRIEAFRQEHLAEHASSVPFHLIATPLSLVADHQALIASIREQSLTPAVVVIDTLNRSLAGSESSDEDMAAYIKASDAIRDAFKCAVVIVHHCGHEGTRPRGHSSLMGALDVQTAVTRDASDKIIATVELMKDGPQGESFASRLQTVELGTDDDGDMITSCVIVPADSDAAPRKTAKLTRGAKIALAALHEAVSECGVVPPECNHIPSGVQQWREYAYRQGVSGSDEQRARRAAFQRAHETLVAATQVGVWEPYAWPTR